ncbi:hypothetical protein M422DRAFT_263429 [Sphaerobolus stellatus SS14]|uniref:Ecp2 effector protein domain-containing protein n=1 Tax=Sphaerobolus stellatus (strain SS14) TaxID=990650 RepID=A0A0C9VB14_SPHS4|nr:hypothetical protein M422DRAFT_263429 [Sphaerobolus stellatus SS14]
MKLSVAFAFLAVNALTVLAVALPAAETELKWTSIEDLSTTDNETSLTKRVGAEAVSCYNFGIRAGRASSISAIDDFCRRYNGRRVDNEQSVSHRYGFGSFTILPSGAAINGCNFVIDGNCNRLLRKPLDECNTSGENGKQGGIVANLCGQWRYDPGSNGSDV